MRKVLLISPHFPPDSSAGAHRVRLLAPYLSKYGWDPTVLTCTPRSYEGQLDAALRDFVPASLRVVEADAWSASATRKVGIALALLDRSVALGSAVSVDVRGRGVPAEVVKPPFVEVQVREG